MEVKEMVETIRENYPQYDVSYEDCDRMEGDTHIFGDITISKGEADSLIGAKIGLGDFMFEHIKESGILAAANVVHQAILRKSC